MIVHHNNVYRSIKLQWSKSAEKGRGSMRDLILHQSLDRLAAINGPRNNEPAMDKATQW